MNELIMFIGIVLIGLGIVVVLYGYSIPNINTELKPTTEGLTYDPMPVSTPVPNETPIDLPGVYEPTKGIPIVEEVVPE